MNIAQRLRPLGYHGRIFIIIVIITNYEIIKIHGIIKFRIRIQNHNLEMKNIKLSAHPAHKENGKKKHKIPHEADLILSQWRVEL